MSNVWWQKGDKIGVGSLSGETVSAISTVKAVRYFGVKYADDFTVDKTEESDIPSAYHRALVAGVIRNFAEEDNDYQTAAYWREVYKEMRREAKIEANIRKDGTAYDVLAQGF